MAIPSPLFTIITVIITTITFNNNDVVFVLGANWCLARSDANNKALQTALDYACASGADCTPILSNGLCFLPNTIQAHASYAFNSFFQRKSMAPGSCDFAGTATIARTDPSYGSCVYPSSLSTAGATTTGTTPTTTTPTTNPNTLTPPLSNTPITGDGTVGLNPGMTPPLPPDTSEASLQFRPIEILILACCLLLTFVLVLIN